MKIIGLFNLSRYLATSVLIYQAYFDKGYKWCVDWRTSKNSYKQKFFKTRESARKWISLMKSTYDAKVLGDKVFK